MTRKARVATDPEVEAGMQPPKALLDRMKQKYQTAGQERWFMQWYERNLANLRWLYDQKVTGKRICELKVLDLGIGWGGASVALPQLGTFVVGLDDFDDAFDRQGIPQMSFLRQMNVPVVRAGLSAIPFKNESFDIVILNNVLEHLVVPRRLMRRINELLSPRGVLILEVPNSVALYKRIKALCGQSNYCRIEKFYREEDYRDHIRECTKWEVKYMLKESGFEPLECRCINQARRPRFDQEHGGKTWARLLLRVYDVISSFSDTWKDHVCCVARKVSKVSYGSS